jgi:histidine triad (HIT) family protein
MVTIGLEVPHAHVHLIPINEANDINFANPKLQLSAEEFQQIQELIVSKL